MQEIENTCEHLFMENYACKIVEKDFGTKTIDSLSGVPSYNKKSNSPHNQNGVTF